MDSTNYASVDTEDHFDGTITPWITYKSIKYYLGPKIGCGTFANCYEFRDLNGNQHIAVKVSKIERGNLSQDSDWYSKKSWQNEVNLISSSKSNYIVQYIASHEDSSLRYIILEQCPTDLQKLHIKEPYMAVSKAKKIVKGVLHGLNYLHGRNIVHRDIKLTNILITLEGSPKICDFGTARKLNADIVPITKSQLCGTKFYLAPESVGKTLILSTAVDVWACGCIMFALLNGRLPFRDKTLTSVYLRILNALFSISENLKKDPEAAEAIRIIHQMFVISYQVRPKASELLADRFFMESKLPVCNQLPAKFVSIYSKHHLLKPLRKIVYNVSSNMVPIFKTEDVDRSKCCWLVGWLNYEGKNGLPYVLSNKTVGIFFNNLRTVQYSSEYEPKYKYFSKKSEIMDFDENAHKKKISLLSIFRDELNELYIQSNHKKTEQILNEVNVIVSYFQNDNIFAVSFANNNLQLKIVRTNYKNPVQMLIDQTYIHVFNGQHYRTYRKESINKDLIDLIQYVIDTINYSN